MPKSHLTIDPDSTLESVSATFVHNISTPLTTALLNAELLQEHKELIANTQTADANDEVPIHIQSAVVNAPELIKKNLEVIQQTIKEYTAFLNAATHGTAQATDQSTADNTDSANSVLDSKAQETTNPRLSPDSRLKILLVDDEDIHHDIGEAVLGVKHSVTHAKNGHDAIAKCQSESFDIILMDMQMPELPGPQTVEKLRTFIDASTMIVGLSNMPIHSKKNELIECGFNGFLDKPLKIAAFNSIIESLT